jgi:hypothetical protein
MDLPEVAGFYQDATDDELEAFEAALDRDDVDGARQLLRTHKASRGDGFLDQPPEEGDLVYIEHTNQFARVVVIDVEHDQAVVDSRLGQYVIPYKSLHRIR